MLDIKVGAAQPPPLLYRGSPLKLSNCSVLTQSLRIPDQHYFLSPRNRKKQSQDKQTPETLHLDDSRMEENRSLSHLKETLISEKPDLPLGETELNEKDADQVFFLPDPQEPES